MENALSFFYFFGLSSLDLNQDLELNTLFCEMTGPEDVLYDIQWCIAANISTNLDCIGVRSSHHIGKWCARADKLPCQAVSYVIIVMYCK